MVISDQTAGYGVQIPSPHAGYWFRPWNSLSRFLNWLARPSEAIFVNSSSCMGLSVTTMRTHSPDGKKSTVSVQAGFDDVNLCAGPLGRPPGLEALLGRP